MKPSQLIQIHEITQQKSDGTPLRLTYCLSRQEAEESDAPLYGIYVRMQEEGREQPEEIQTPPISYSEAFVRLLLERVSANAVTPLCLMEVLDELISTWEEA